MRGKSISPHGGAVNGEYYASIVASMVHTTVGQRLAVSFKRTFKEIFKGNSHTPHTPSAALHGQRLRLFVAWHLF